jgi:biopolymer transport protein ExbD
VPVTPSGLDALVPQPPKNPQKTQDNDRTIVVQVLYNQGAQPSYKINETPVTHADLGSQLSGIFATRAEKVMFIKGDDKLNFSSIADVIDIGHDSGVDHIGLITPKIEAGQ